MPKGKDVQLNQTFIPVPVAGKPVDPDDLYADVAGRDAYHRQVQRLREERDCTCGIGNAQPSRNHRAGCKAIPLHHGRRS